MADDGQEHEIVAVAGRPPASSNHDGLLLDLQTQPVWSIMNKFTLTPLLWTAKLDILISKLLKPVQFDSLDDFNVACSEKSNHL